jgi:hypothetical protein
VQLLRDFIAIKRLDKFGFCPLDSCQCQISLFAQKNFVQSTVSAGYTDGPILKVEMGYLQKAYCL